MDLVSVLFIEKCCFTKVSVYVLVLLFIMLSCYTMCIRLIEKLFLIGILHLVLLTIFDCIVVTDYSVVFYMLLKPTVA